jgi:hypothetical protein
MADNVAITAGSGTNIAADDVSSVFYQRVKLDYGDDGATAPVTAATPLPVLPYALPASTVMGSTAKIEDTNATAIIAAQGEGVKIYLTTVIVTNSDATVGTLVKIQDGADTPVVLCQGYAAPAGGGFVATFPVPPATTANKALNAICVTTSAEVYVTAVGYKGA